MRLLLPEARPIEVEDLLDLYDCADSSFLRAGFVLATDGGVVADGSSRPLRSCADEAVFHALRAVADAVVVGAGTVRTERYGPVRPRPAGRAWRAAHGRTACPPLVIVSRSLDLDPGSPCFHGPVVVVTCEATDPVRRGRLAEVAEIVVAGVDEVDLPAAVVALHDRGLSRLLCEGGPRLLTGLVQAGLVDELCLTLTPLLLGAAPQLLSTPLAIPVRLQLRSLVDGEDGVLLARYATVPDPGPAAAQRSRLTTTL